MPKSAPMQTLSSVSTFCHELSIFIFEMNLKFCNFFLSENTKIGRKDADPAPDIPFSGLRLVVLTRIILL